MDNQEIQEVRRVHGALIKNERLKLYKKPSTWILMGIIVGIMLLGIIITQSLSSTDGSPVATASWKEDYNSQLQKYTVALNGSPNQPTLKSKVECLTYLINNEISPSDWRTDAVTEYYNLKYGIAAQSDAGTSGKYNGYMENGTADTTGTAPSVSESTLDPAQTEQQMEQLMTVIENNDWKTYIHQRIDDLNSGAIASASDSEKQVDIEICNLYLDNNVTPVSNSSANNTDYTYGDSQSGDMWKSTMIQTIRGDKLCILRGEDAQGALLTQTQSKKYQKEIDVDFNRLKTDTKPIQSSSFLGLMESSVSSLGLLSIMLVVIASNSIANEFSTGTIKLLLITPHKRKKIFWAKAVLLVEVSAIAAAAAFLLSFLISGAYTGFSGIGSMQVISLFGKVMNVPYLIYILFLYLLSMLPVLTYGALALMMSAVTRKSGVSIAITLVLLYGGNIIMSLLVAFSKSKVLPGVKFLLFANTSLEKYLSSSSATAQIGVLDSTMTLGFSVVILFVYMACFLWIARDSFCRRDVK